MYNDELINFLKNHVKANYVDYHRPSKHEIWKVEKIILPGITNYGLILQFLKTYSRNKASAEKKSDFW